MLAERDPVTIEQQEALIDFLECHKELALGRFSRTKEGRHSSKRLWQECADLLNSVSADCHRRKADAWRTYYADYKSKLIKRIKRNKQESGNGGQPYPLTSLQERLYSLLRREGVEPLPGVRQNPFAFDVTIETESGDDGGEEKSLLELPFDGDIPTPTSTSLSLGQDWAVASTSRDGLDVKAMDIATALVTTNTAAIATATAAMASASAAKSSPSAAKASTSAAKPSTSAAKATTSAAKATTSAANLTNTAATTTAVPKYTNPRRRRRRQSQSRSRSPSRSRRRRNCRQEQEMTPLEAAEQRLAAMEARSADATFALAEAINRLANALKRHSRRPMQVEIISDHENQSRRRRRRNGHDSFEYSSESD